MPWRKHNELTLNDAAGIAAAALAAASCVFIFHETPILLLSEIRPIPWFLTEEIEVIVTNVSLYAPRYERRFCLRPTIMQLDLQSVEKVPFSTLAWVFAPKMFEIGLPRLRMACSFLQDLSRAVPRFSRGPFAGNRLQHFFDPTGLQTPIGSKIAFFDPIIDCNRISPSWIEKELTVISCNWVSGEAGNSSG